MPATIRSNREVISRQFPYAGFTVRTGGDRYFEVAVSTDPQLLRAAGRPKRTSANFYSSHASGPLVAERGEAVYLIPPEVLRRFSGSGRLYYMVATSPSSDFSTVDIASFSAEAVPWLGIAETFTGNESRQLLGIPARRRNGNGGSYGPASSDSLTWAADRAFPGEVLPASPARTVSPGAGASAPAAQQGVDDEAIGYDDGYGEMPPLARQMRTPAALVPMIESIAGAAVSRIAGGKGDVRWALEQMKGIKHPGDDPANAGGGPLRDAPTVRVGDEAWIENHLGDRIQALFDVDWQCDGRSLGNVSITNRGVNDALGWGLSVDASIIDDAAVHEGRAALAVRFHFLFERIAGNPVIERTDLLLYGDGTFEKRTYRTQEKGAVAQGNGAAVSRELAAPVLVPIATAILGAVMKKLLDNEGDIKWELEQLEGAKYVLDDPMNEGPKRYDKHVEVIEGPRVYNHAGLGRNYIYADYEITWWSNGRTVRDISISPAGMSDAPAFGLSVKAKIMNDPNAYTLPPDATTFAAVPVRFEHIFDHTWEDDRVRYVDLVLYGNGKRTMKRTRM